MVHKAAKILLYTICLMTMMCGIYLIFVGEYFQGLAGIVAGPMLYYGVRLQSRENSQSGRS